MSTTVWSLLAVCAVASVLHRAPVVSQCTTNHCYDGDSDVRALTALVYRLQDTVERQVHSLEQQQRHNQELQGQLATLRETVEQQQTQNQELQTQLKTFNETMYLQEKRLMIHEDTLAKQNESTYSFTPFMRVLELFVLLPPRSLAVPSEIGTKTGVPSLTLTAK